MTRQAQKQFENNLAKNSKENPKAIWQYIKSKSKLKEGITELNTDPHNEKSRLTSDNTEKATKGGSRSPQCKCLQEPTRQILEKPGPTIRLQIETEH